MKHIPKILFASIFLMLASLSAQPVDNPVASQYGDGYPAWTDQIAWDNVLDVTTDARLSGQVIVADNPSSAAANFAAFEVARDVLYADGGGVLFFPAGTYYFEQPDAGYGPGIGPNSRGLMLKKGIVIRGDALVGSNAVIRNPSEKLDVSYDLEPSTVFVFPFQKRGTVPANATGVDGELAGTDNAAGETPTDWNFIGITPGANETGVSDVDNVGVVNVTLQGGTVVFGFDTEWAAFMGDTGVKWEGNKFKVDWPTGSAAESEDWINRVPNGEHYGDLINGRSGWTKEVISGSGRLVMNTKIVDGAPWMDFIYADRNDSSSTNLTADAFAHYRFAGRVIAYGSNVFIANNVLAKPTRNFVHDQLQDTGIQTILFDYANHLGIDVNKSLLGGNQGHPSVHVIDGEGYYASNIVIKDNWVFNRGNKGFEVAGRHVVISGNHNQRYVSANQFPYEYITNPEAYPLAVEGGDIDAGGISFDGYRWQSTESASDYLSRGYDLGGMDVWVDDCTVINTGSRGNDGEAILGQRHNNIETCSWSVTNSKFGPYTIDDSPSSSSGANAGYIGPYDMHTMGLFLMHNSGAGSVGMFKPESNYMLDGTWAGNAATQATPGTGHSDDWIAPGKAAVPHADAVNAPVLSAAMNADATGIELSWVDNATNELGFRVERRINGGDWTIISYRPRASENGVAAYPDATIASAVGQFDVGDIVQTQWTDYLAPLEESLEYRVVAINANDDDSTGISNVEVLSSPFMSGSLDVEGLVAGAIDGQEGWAYTADGASRLPGDGVAVTAGGLDWTAADGGMIAAGTQHLYTQAGLGTNGKMDRWLSYSPVSISGPSYIRFVAMMETRPGDSTIGATDPYELFFGLTNNASISGAPWNAYVALKHSADGSAVGVETTNSGGLLANAGVALDTPMLVVVKYETDVDGALVGMKVWINPDEADEGSPDHTITFDSPGVVLADQDHLKFRMQNMPTRIDHLMVAGSWAEVVPEAPVLPYPGLFLPFDDLNVGLLSGQDGWTINSADISKAIVANNVGLTYTASDGTMVKGGTTGLVLSGSPSSKMNNFATRPLDPTPTGTTYFRILLNSGNKGTAADPGELFVRLAGWNLYVAAKYYAGVIELPGGNSLEVDTTNGLPLDQTHVIIMGMNAEGGVVTSLDLWLNPVADDSGTPDLTVDGLDLDISAVSQLELRSQNTQIFVDEIALAETWEEVAPESSTPFESLASSFDDLNIGTINGQGEWAIDAADEDKAVVAGGSLTYIAPDGAELTGGTQHLVLSGSPDPKMNNWLTLPVVPGLDATTYFRALVSTSDAGVPGSPAELFIRLAGWSLYIGTKFSEGIVELPGPNVIEVDTTNGLPLDVTHMLLLRMNVSDGAITSLDFWLNPAFGDESTPDLSVNPFNLTLESVSQIELRSQNTTTLVDELLLAETWAELVPEATTPVAPTVLADPASVSVLVGEPVQLSVSAAGTPTLTYQWRKDGVNIDGATGSSYAIASAALTDAGNYDVVVTNGQGTATSAAAIVEVTEEVIVPVVTLFEETFDSGATEETAAPVALADLGWNVHHSFAGINLDGLLVDPENADETLRNLEMETSTSIGDFNIGEPYGYMSFFVNNYPAYGQGSEGDRPALPGPHPDTGLYYHNRTLATFLWKEAGISEADRSTITEFNFVQGNRDASQHNFFPAVQIDGQWYVYIVDQETLGTDVRILGRPGQNDPNGAETVFSGSQFSEGGAYANYYNAQPYSFAWSESGWTELVFDGGAGTNSTVGMTLGDPVAGELPMSAITAVGVYSPENIDPGYNFNGLRIDSIQILGEAQQEDLFTFTFNNEGTVNGSDRPIQAAEWDGLYSTTAQSLITNEAVIADLSEGVSDDTTPGSYKAGFLFVSGKNDQPAPEGFLVYSTNTNVVDVPQLPQGGAETVNPQTDWYSDPTNSVSDLNQLLAKDLGELQMRINPRNTSIRYHFALQIGGEWYVSQQAFQHTGSGSWESVSLNAGSANWLSGVVGVDSINFDFTAVAPSVVKLADLASDVTLDTVGIYIDTDDGIGTTDTWARVDSITLSSVVPALQGPTITEQPASLAVTTGGTAEFSVGVEMVDGVTYQWRKDGVDLDGETAATLTLSEVSEADEGDYDVVVSNAAGLVTSTPATLTVYALPILDNSVFDIDSTAQSLQVILTAEATDVVWSAAEAQDGWITITYAGSGQGSDLILFGVSENPDYTSRSGTLTVAGQTVTINQQGKPLPASFEEAVGAVDNGDGSFTSTWFGTFTSPGMDWIVHEEAGLLHVGAVVVPTDMVMFSFPVNGWVWTSEAAFPIMYEFTTGEWIYYVVVDQSVYVYSYDLDSWSY